MDADALPIAESVSQLELSVDANLASLSRNDVISAEARLQVILQGMRGYLNALSPINRLPPEMLLAIFKQALGFCMRPPVLNEYDDGEMVDTKALFRLVHVCGLWRSIAIGDASLWSHVDVAHPETVVKLFLRRSSGYPLTLYASMEKSAVVNRILKEHGARVRTVYVNRKGQMAVNMAFPTAHFHHVPVPPFHPLALAFHPALAPPLHPAPGLPFQPALPFHPALAPPFYPALAPPFQPAPAMPFHPVPALPFNNHDSDMSDMVEAPSSVFQRFCSGAPQLECFTLREPRAVHSFFHSSSAGQGDLQASDSPLKALALLLPDAFFPTNSFPNLTHLFLSFPLSRAQNDAESLLRMLSRAPRLQFLQLSNLYIGTSSAYFMHSLPPVSLDQLRLLVFGDGHLEMAFYLLKYLALPESVLLSIEGSGRRDDLGSGPLSLRLPHVAPLNTVTFMEISVDFSALLLTGYDAEFTSGFLLKAHGNSEIWSARWLGELHAMMSLSMITVLHINDIDGTVLPQLLPYFVQLEQLSVLLLPSNHETANMAQTAGALFASLTPPVTTLVCPALRSLGLEADIHHDTFPYAELEAMAIGRYRRGLPLRRFVYRFKGSTRRWSTAEAEEMKRMFLVDASLSPLLQPYVESVEYRLSSSEKLCPFVPRECWRVPDAERYWRVPQGKEPNYGLPWDNDTEPYAQAEGDDDNEDEDEDEDDGVYDLSLLG